MDLFTKLKSMKILLIDDDEWIRDSLKLFFESEGCQIIALETAEEGLKALQCESYDIIITDYKLPGIDGLTFLEQIQASQTDAVKILITAYKSKEVISQAKKIGVQGLIAKPFTSQTIETSLAILTANH